MCKTVVVDSGKQAGKLIDIPVSVNQGFTSSLILSACASPAFQLLRHILDTLLSYICEIRKYRSLTKVQF